MPQLDPSTYLSQLFWLMISFLILWVGIHYLTKDLKKILEERKAYIMDRLHKAQACSKDFEAYEQTQDKQKKTAERLAKAQILEKKKEAQQQLDLYRKKAEAKQEVFEKNKLQEIQTAYQQEKTFLVKEIAKLSPLLKKKLIFKNSKRKEDA